MKLWCLFLAIGLTVGVLQSPTADLPLERAKADIEKKLADLSARVEALRAKNADPDLLADVDIYHRAAAYIFRFPEEFAGQKFVADTERVLEAGLERARELERGAPSWPARKGHVVRGYVSRVDGTVQPYGLTIPDSYDGSRPVRLDIWQHGTNRSLNEVAFITQQQSDRPIPPGQDYIQLEPLGRTNVSYRWAGEADLFEALESVQQRYKIDPKRIVLRGFSMGGASTWHLGLHHPGTWAAIEAGAGYTETRRYGHRENLPPYQEAMLHYYDAVDYALNAFNTPTVGYGGEIDAQLQASVNIREQLMREGFRFEPDGPYRWITGDLRALFLVGPQTGHAWHPESRNQSNAFIAQALKSADVRPSHVRFVTYTTRFNAAHWLTVDGLEETYKRAEVEARRGDDGKQYTVTTKNISRITFESAGGMFAIDGQTLNADASSPRVAQPFRTAMPVAQPFRAAMPVARPFRAAMPTVTFEKQHGKWALASTDPRGLRKEHGLQGPVDDAFMDAFLCVRPTGTPWNPVTAQWAARALDVFERDFAKWLRGDVRVKDDRAISARDIADNSLILFGDPGSNSVLASIIGRLPVRWTKTEIAIGAQAFAAADHVPVLIYPNPLNPKRYVVINSGHTFGEEDFKGTNAWLYPRLGDYAVLTASGDVAMSGFFDEEWRVK